MRKTNFLLFAFITYCVTGAAQDSLFQKKANPRTHLSENTIVKDSSGLQFPFETWRQMLASGDYSLKAINPENENTEFIIVRISESQKEKMLSSLPKPQESKFFRTGEKFTNFRASDINGKRVNTKEFVGKIIVLNFWFINCPPCRMEIPSLNELSESYKDDSLIVFFAVALDPKNDLKDFLKLHPFGYRVIDQGKYITQQYGISMYPTNVVINQQGKVSFHSSGFGMNTVYWIRKTIEDLKANNTATLNQPGSN